jgi:hypothetical protein
MATRANVENVVIHRLGRLMAQAGRDGTTVDGTNADLDAAISSAVRQVGGSVADISTVTPAEVAAVPDASLDEMVDYAELRAAEDVVADPDDMDPVVRQRLEKHIEGVLERVERLYGYWEEDPDLGVIAGEDGD